MKKYVQAFTLLEFLIANFLIVLIFVMIANMYTRARITYNQLTILADLLENSRFITYIFKNKIQQPNFLSCAINRYEQLFFIKGYRHKLPAYLKNHVLSETDVVEINSCEANRFETKAYFVAASHRKNVVGQELYSLYEKRKNGIREEIISGVESLSIEYALSCPNSANICSYANADDVKDWGNVVAVHFVIGLVSEKAYFVTLQEYSLDKKLYASDNRLHKKWYIYLALKNENRISN